MRRTFPILLTVLIGFHSGFGQSVPNVRSTPPTAHSVDSALEKISKEAEAARNGNRVDDAIALYKKGISLRPSWDEGWWYLGTLYYDLDNYEQGRDSFKHLTLIKPDVAVAWGMLGLCEYQTRQYEDSLKHLRHAVELGVAADQSISDVMHYHLVLLLTRFGEFQEAMKNMAMFAQRSINQPDYIEAMGIAALRKPVLPNELPPTERELVMDVGRAMYDASALKTADAYDEFKSLVAKYPTQPNVHFVYGSFLLFSDLNQGIAELKKELEISPGHVPALVTLASEYLKSDDYKTALPYAEKAVAVDPESFPAHAVLGRILVEGELDLPRGVKELETARKLAPGSPQVHIALASAYSKSGRKEDAAKEREEFLKTRKLTDESNKTVP
jgi:tetratricopeptide (TPR) repeat protein